MFAGTAPCTRCGDDVYEAHITITPGETDCYCVIQAHENAGARLGQGALQWSEEPQVLLLAVGTFIRGNRNGEVQVQAGSLAGCTISIGSRPEYKPPDAVKVEDILEVYYTCNTKRPPEQPPTRKQDENGEDKEPTTKQVKRPGDEQADSQQHNKQDRRHTQKVKRSVSLNTGPIRQRPGESKERGDGKKGRGERRATSEPAELERKTGGKPVRRKTHLRQR